MSLFETYLSSGLDKDFENKGKKNLSSFTCRRLTPADVNKYSKVSKLLSGDDFNINDQFSHAYFDGEELVGYVCVNREGDGLLWITELEVMKKYRGYGLSTQLLDVAVKKDKAQMLGVMTDNKIALHLYEKYGFKKTDEGIERVKKGELDFYRMYYPGNIDKKTVEHIYAINESMDKSTVDKDFKTERKNTFTLVDIQSSATKKFIGPRCITGWKDEKTRERDIARNYGYIAVDEKGEVAGCIFVYREDTKWPNVIHDVFVKKTYRGQGLSEDLLAKAIAIGGNMLYVYADNEVAIKMYKNAGFRIVKTGKDQTGEKCHVMRLGTKANKAENEPIKASNVTEACKDLATARKLVQDVQKLGKKYNANFFFVTDGASGYSNGNGEHNPAAKACRSFMDNWEKDNGFNPDDDWSKDPSDTSNYKLHEATREDMPKVCPKCGGKVVCVFRGEPVYICQDCNKYFGTLNPGGDVTPANEGTTWSTKERYPVYIVPMHTGTTFSNVIKTFTRDEFSHVAIAFNSKLDPMYTFGTRTDGKGKGLDIKAPNDPFFKGRHCNFKVFVVYVNKAAKDAMMKICKEFESNIDKYRYDVIGCIQTFFHISSETHSNAYFCSRFVSMLLSKGMELAKLPSLYKPQDIAELDNISLVNDGNSFETYDFRTTEANARLVRASALRTNSLVEGVILPETYRYYYVSKQPIPISEYVYINPSTCSPSVADALALYAGDETDAYVYTHTGPGKARCIGQVHLKENGDYKWNYTKSIVDEIFNEDMAPVIGSGAVSTFVHICLPKMTFVNDPEKEDTEEYILSRPGMTDIFRVLPDGAEKLTREEFKKRYHIKETYEYINPMTTIEYLRLINESTSGRDAYVRLAPVKAYDDLSKDTRFKKVDDFFTEMTSITNKMVSEFLFTLPKTSKVMEVQKDLIAALGNPLNENEDGVAHDRILTESVIGEQPDTVGLIARQIAGVLESIY